MPDEKTDGCCGSSTDVCCSVDAIIGVDERGQMVLPKELREKAQIHAGDKFAAMSMRRGNESCCIVLVKVDELTEMVKGTLGPIMGELFKEQKR